MRIVTWNVNGLSTLVNYSPWCSGNFTTLHEEITVPSKTRTPASPEQLLNYFDCDILCLQETKMNRQDLFSPQKQTGQHFANVPGYSAFFSFSQKRKGYSGVVTYCRGQEYLPFHAEQGITGILESSNSRIGGNKSLFDQYSKQSLRIYDIEGRCVITDHGKFVLFNVYFPHADSLERYEFKMEFYRIFEKRVRELIANGRNVILAGDLNVAHRPIDHCDPMKSIQMQFEYVQEFIDPEITLEKMTFGGSPARQWFDELLQGDSCILVDTFRYLHPNEEGAFTCWNTRTNAREGNYGTRIDYVLVDSNFFEMVGTLSNCQILSSVKGSDHCPVLSEFDFTPSPPFAVDHPSLSTKHMAELKGKQQSISSFFAPKPHQSCENKEIGAATRTSSKRRRKENPITLQEFGFTTKHSEDYSETSHNSSKVDNKHEVDAWSSILSGSPDIPLCKHGEPCVLRTVSKKGVNRGRIFYTCQFPDNVHASKRGEIHSSCGYFEWKRKRKLSSKS